MHPDIARELISQRASEMRAQASRDAIARRAARSRRDRRAEARSRRDRLAVAGEIPVPRVPDYVDDELCGAVDHTHAGA
jgi:hypothetical protein